MATSDPLARTPYYFAGRRPFREERLLSYIRRDELGLEPDPAEDARAATKITVWFEGAAA